MGVEMKFQMHSDLYTIEKPFRCCHFKFFSTLFRVSITLLVCTGTPQGAAVSKL